MSLVPGTGRLGKALKLVLHPSLSPWVLRTQIFAQGRCSSKVCGDIVFPEQINWPLLTWWPLLGSPSPMSARQTSVPSSAGPRWCTDCSFGRWVPVHGGPGYVQEAVGSEYSGPPAPGLSARGHMGMGSVDLLLCPWALGRQKLTLDCPPPAQSHMLP